MLKKDDEILKNNNGENLRKVQFIIYTEFESLLEKTNICYNNPEKPL